VIALVQVVLQLLTDLAAFVALAVRQRGALAAEILVLRRQLALYVERGVKPRRIDPITRISLTLLSRFSNWRDALVVVRPETLIRWHSAGWRLFWRLKSRPGRPPIPKQLQALIRRMANDNPSWGEERIANELLLKLGIQVSPRTVRKYLPRRPPTHPRGDLRWSTFLRLHAQGIIACDFLVVVTATFRLLYVFVVIEHGSRRLLHFNVTAHPSSAWTLQQLREAVGFEKRYQYPTARSRQHLCHGPGRIGKETRNHGVEVASTLPEGQRDLQTNHRHDSARVFGLVNPAVRTASAIHSANVDSPLQCRASAHGTGSGYSRSATCVFRLPKIQIAPSPRRVVRGPFQANPWRTASRILPRADMCVTDFLRTTAVQSQMRRLKVDWHFHDLRAKPATDAEHLVLGKQHTALSTYLRGERTKPTV
jgi:hypothetical protein